MAQGEMTRLKRLYNRPIPPGKDMSPAQIENDLHEWERIDHAQNLVRRLKSVEDTHSNHAERFCKYLLRYWDGRDILEGVRGYARALETLYRGGIFRFGLYYEQSFIRQKDYVPYMRAAKHRARWLFGRMEETRKNREARRDFERALREIKDKPSRQGNQIT